MWNVGQAHQVIMSAWRVCYEQLLCKTLTAIIAAEKQAEKQAHQVIMSAWRVCYEQLLCKVWHSQLSQRRETGFNARVDVKLWQSHWSMKCRPMAPGHNKCLKAMLWTITMQGLTLTAVIATEKHYDKVTGAWNVGQEHRVVMLAWQVCYEQLLYKVWHSQLS